MGMFDDLIPGKAKPVDLQALAKAEGLSPAASAVAASIYEQESGSGRNTRTSNAGAVGGMQIIPATFARFAQPGESITNPQDNARVGLRYVKHLHELANGDPALTAVGYYGGEGAIPLAQRGQAVSDPRNPQAPNTLQYAEQVVSRIPAQKPVSFDDLIPKAPAEQPKEPSGPERTRNNSLSAQAGLTLRAGARGLAGLAGMVTDPIGGVYNAAADALGIGGPRAQQLVPTVDRLLTSAGVPEPDTRAQRIVGKGAEAMAGAGAAAGLANAAARGAAPVARQVLQRLGADVPTQAIASGAAGAAGQQAAENGEGWGGQFTSAMLAGGLAGGAAGGAKALAGRLAPGPALPAVEKTVTAMLEQRGVDFKSLSPAIRAQLLEDARKAMKLGSLDDAALARLADYKRLGLTPTRGRLTLDPLDITREQNAMRVAAATGATDARLPQIAQGNNRGLLAAVDDMRPAPDRFAAGEAAIAPILGRDASMKAQVDALYAQARDQGGRSAQLDGAAFTRAANEALQKNLAPKLGGEVDSVLNDIATGKTPLTVEYAEQLKTMLGRKAQAAKATQGDLAYAYGIVRDALDNTPLMQAPKVNPGNLPAVAGTVPVSPAAVGQEAIDAFNAARSSARQRFSWRDSAPGIQRALDGAAPENWIRDNILSRSAGIKDVAKVAADIRTDPAALEATRGAIVQHLKEAAIGKGNDTATGNFSGRQWKAALADIGPQKLGMFFSKDEIGQLEAIGRVGIAETFQPRGSAVNNSNTAAGVAGLLQGITRNIKPLANKIPFGQEAIVGPADRITLSLMERGANNIPRGLLAPMPRMQQGGLLDPLLLPAVVSGGLLAP